MFFFSLIVLRGKADDQSRFNYSMIKRYEKQLITIKSQQEDLVAFDKKFAELANQRITLDLDDGVVVNYTKLQDVLGKIQ